MDQDKKGIADNIKQQARYAQKLYIWTDCDREGEHIGVEVRTQALLGNPRIEVKRARFSNTERASVVIRLPEIVLLINPSHIIAAANAPHDLDDRQANAVAARIELDLRIGASFTRLQTLQLRRMGGPLEGRTISYGRLTWYS